MPPKRGEDKEAAAKRPRQYRDISSRVYQAVAGHQFIVIKKLGQDAELQRAEKGRLRPHTE
ncbi:hypothetical protein SDC9_118714 [bioreactor metagenome]|uniref:Uncharacterized protein n=1 Tax=bioreactor metagenome TaxID=1076179 RepID=A0A645C879_9ZZZZ